MVCAFRRVANTTVVQMDRQRATQRPEKIIGLTGENKSDETKIIFTGMATVWKEELCIIAAIKEV
jgi:hypothetical protein